MTDDAMDIVREQPATADGATAPASANAPTAAAVWDTPKHREEVENVRQKLSDQGFRPADFGDPLTSERPLQMAYSRPFPDGTEANLRQLLADARKKRAAA